MKLQRQPGYLRWQELTGLVFGFFALTHLFNHALASFGKGYWESFRNATSAVYQHPLIELLIFASLTGHLSLALLQALSRPNFLQLSNLFGANANRIEWQRVTGWLLASVILGHVFFTRALPLLYRLENGVEFGGLTYTLASTPIVFYPYYIAFSLAAVYHAFTAFFHTRYFASIKRSLGIRVSTASPLYIALLSLFGLGVIAGLLAMGGFFYQIADPYDNPYARLQEQLFKGYLH